MSTAVRWSLTPFLILVGAGIVRASSSRQRVWQADIQIRTLEVTKTRARLSIRVIVYTENDDAAKDARLLILLPVGVGIERLGPGCAATPGPAMVPSLRATVACDLGAIADRGFREVALTTSLPAEGQRKWLGVFAYSATPDPVPGNNYAERAVP